MEEKTYHILVDIIGHDIVLDIPKERTVNSQKSIFRPANISLKF